MGVVPLVFSSGAGAEMRHAMGVAVFSGMLGVTFFGLLLTPVFYVLIRNFVERGEARKAAKALEAGGATMSLKAFLPSLLVLALSACAVGPDYKTPATEAANITAATDGAAGQKNFDRSRFEGIWWQQFEDPTLNQLVTQSLQGQPRPARRLRPLESGPGDSR